MRTPARLPQRRSPHVAVACCLLRQCCTSTARCPLSLLRVRAGVECGGMWPVSWGCLRHCSADAVLPGDFCLLVQRAPSSRNAGRVLPLSLQERQSSRGTRGRGVMEGGGGGTVDVLCIYICNRCWESFAIPRVGKPVIHQSVCRGNCTQLEKDNRIRYGESATVYIPIQLYRWYPWYATVQVRRTTCGPGG